jgi:hypothetical protein
VHVISSVQVLEQELFTLPEHLSSSPVFSEVRVTGSLVLYVCFVDRYLSFCTFSFGHSVVCSPSIYGLWLRLWYLQTLLTKFWIRSKKYLWYHWYTKIVRLRIRTNESCALNDLSIFVTWKWNNQIYWESTPIPSRKCSFRTWDREYSQTCINMSPSIQGNNGFLRQVTS